MDNYKELIASQLDTLYNSMQTLAETLKNDTQSALQSIRDLANQQTEILTKTMKETNDIFNDVNKRIIQYNQQLVDILFSFENQAIYQLVSDHIFLDKDMEDLPLSVALDIINEYYEEKQCWHFTTDDIATLIAILSCFSNCIPDWVYYSLMGFLIIVNIHLLGD